MKLLERLARRDRDRGFHTTIITSFAVEFAAVEEILLPHVMASGATNVLLIADDRMTAMALSDGFRLPRQLGRDYALFGPAADAGLFHPKIVLQLGRSGGRAFVSSANATAAGLGGNLEIATEIDCSADPSPQQDFVRAIWRYIDQTVSESDGAARDALTWARERTPWISAPSSDGVGDLGDDGLIQFLATPNQLGIIERFAALVNDGPVDRLVVVSPFWDENLEALEELDRRLAPARTTVLLDTERHDFPSDADYARNVEIMEITGWEGSRYTHAKLFIASTANFDHVLSGSANCTVAALGKPGFPGANAEACVYRRFPVGEATQSLDLDEWLSQEPIVGSSLTRIDRGSPIPLASVAERRPGRFETLGSDLAWLPPEERNWQGATIELIDQDGRCTLRVPADSLRESGPWRIGPCASEVWAVVRFARLVFDEETSTLTPITFRSVLKSRRREPASGNVAKALALFDGQMTPQLFMQQALEELLCADFEENEPSSIDPVRRPQRRLDEAQPTPVVLSYEEFMAERATSRGEARIGENSLAGTLSDSVRTLLNRLCGIEPDSESQASAADDWGDMTDETGELAEDDGANPGRPPLQEPIAPAPVDGRTFERAVAAYSEAYSDESRAVGPGDVLRLRWWLMLLLYNAKSPQNERGLTCSIGEQSWPRLALRVLSTFFWGKKPPVLRLAVPSTPPAMPPDYLECWATVLWAMHKIEDCLPPSDPNRAFLGHVSKLRPVILSRLRLTAADVNGETMMAINRGLDETIGHRLLG